MIEITLEDRNPARKRYKKKVIPIKKGGKSDIESDWVKK